MHRSVGVMLDAAGATSSARARGVATLECAGNSRPGHTDVTGIWVSLDGGASWVQGDFLDPISRRGAAGNTIGSRRHNRAAPAAGARLEKSNAPSQTVTIRMSAAM